MDECPICGKRIDGRPRRCPECGAPLRDDPAGLERAEQSMRTPAGLRASFARFCLGLGMVVSLLGAVGAVALGIALLVRGAEYAALALAAAPVGFCVCVAHFLVFQKVRRLYDAGSGRG